MEWLGVIDIDIATCITSATWQHYDNNYYQCIEVVVVGGLFN